MKKVWTAVAMAAFLFATLALAAQDPQAPQGGGPGMGMGHHGMGMGGPGKGGAMRMDPQQRADRMARMLNLSDDQKSKLVGILQDEQKQVSDLRGNTSLTPQDRRSKMQETLEGTNSQIRALLNSDQQQKYDQMMQRMRDRRERNRGGSQGQGQSQTQGQGQNPN